MRGTKPTLKQKKKLAALGLRCENWLIVKDTPQEFVVKHKYSGNVRKCSIVDKLLNRR